MKKLFIILILCFFVQGCVTTKTEVKLVPQTLTGQKIIDQEGADAVISHKKTSVAVRPPSGTFLAGGRPMLYISVYGTESFDFSADDIKVFVDGKPHRIVSYDDLVDEVNRDQGNMAAAFNAKYAAQSNRSADNAIVSTSNPEVFNPSDNPNNVGDTSKYGYKLDINSIAQNQSQINAQKQYRDQVMAQQRQKALIALNKMVLKRTTVPPDTWYGRYIVIEAIPESSPESVQPHDVKVVVTADGEKHEFLLNYSENQK